MTPGAADFRLLDREVVDALKALPECERFLRGLVSWVGFRVCYVPFDAPERLSGTTKYSFLKMVTFALGGLTSFSTRPLRLSFLLGLIVAFLAFVYGCFTLGCYMLGVPLSVGWASTILAVLILGSVQLLCVGILSEYVGRLITEVKHRSTYIVRSPRASGDNSERSRPE